MDAPNKAAEIKAVFAAILAFLTALWGWTGWLILVMICAMFIDYLTGSWAARRDGFWSSDIARDGLWHKAGELVALLLAALCDFAVRVLLHTEAAAMIEDFTWRNYITLMVTTWYIFTEFGSIVENLSKLGVPIPKWLGRGIALLKGKFDNVVPEESSPDTHRAENADKDEREDVQ